MPSNDNEQPEMDDADMQEAFARCMMQNSLLHRVESGLDPLHIHRFQRLGLLEGAVAPPMSSAIGEILRDRNHPARIAVPDGPLVFVREEGRLSVVEPSMLLLNPDREIRLAALDYLKQGTLSPNPWLSTRAANLLENRTSDSQSEEMKLWRAAGIELTPVIREDLFGHLAGLRQSIAAHYEEGVAQYLGSVMRPTFKTLVDLRPSLWSPTEQRDEVKEWIAEWAVLPTLDTALTQYANRCGYIPLCGELGAAELARQWIAQHPDSELNWDVLWSWAENAETPFAKYHAIIVALYIPSTRPTDSMNQFWTEVIKILDIGGGDDVALDSNVIWQLHCELASHFARHVEALYPEQDGERIACYAWWLAQYVGQIFGKSNEQAQAALDGLVRQEAELSFSRWSIARSPIMPSSFRYTTLTMSSVWAMSLLAQLSQVASSLPLDDVPSESREKIGSIFKGYLITSPLANDFDSTALVFAYQENSRITDLCIEHGLVSDEERAVLTELIRLRKVLGNPGELQSRLERLRQLPKHEQHLTAMFLRETVYSTRNLDDAVSAWLAQTSQVAEDLLYLPDSLLEPMLGALVEFQQRYHAEWPTRLPHLLAYAVEQTDDEQRAKLLYMFVLVMSINGGIVSPIQRVASSKWRSDFLGSLGDWRGMLVEVARHSEPWLGARVRATSATISRLIGPRNQNTPTLDQTSSVES